jgi:proteasome lid subunit RPN8/RPN11
MALVLSSHLHDAICAHLEGTFPNEGGGFLIGVLEGGHQHVREARFVPNTFASEEQYHRYLMEAGAYQAAEDYADSQGLALLGYFHSHPNHPAVPSEFDRAHALPNFTYLIVSVRAQKAAESLAWQLTADRTRFEPLPLEIEP